MGRKDSNRIQIGDKVKLKVNIKGEGKTSYVVVPIGAEFIVESLPPVTMKKGTNYNYFLFGHTYLGTTIRAFVEEVEKLEN
jgi:hypothetical protein